MPQDQDDSDFEVSSTVEETPQVEPPADPAAATPEGGAAIPAAGGSSKSDESGKTPEPVEDDSALKVPVFDENDLSTYARDDHGCYVHPVTKKRFMVDINGKRIPASEDQNAPVCVQTAQDLEPIFAAQNEAAQKARLEQAARENPAVATLLEENNKLRAQLEALKPKRASKKEAAK